MGRPTSTRSRFFSVTSSCALRSQPETLSEHGVRTDNEVELLVVHGILHLLGMDHEDDDEAQLMEQRQSDMLARFGSSSA